MKEELKTEITENNITYRLSGDYYIPFIILKEKDERPIGKYGMLRKIFLKEQHPARYNEMLLTGELQKHLVDIDEQAHARMDILTEQMQVAEGVTEDLKSRDWRSWLRKVNSIQNRAEEIVLAENVYVYGK